MMKKIRRCVLFYWLIILTMLSGVLVGMKLPVQAATTDGTLLTEALVREVDGTPYYDLQPGTRYIDDDVDLEYGILVEFGTVTINLNGHTLNYAGTSDNYSVIYVTGGKLTVNDGIITGGKGNNEIHNGINAERRGGGFAVAGDDTVVTINHVTIRDNEADWGGGLFLDNCNCRITLNHSTVTNNVAKAN